MGDIKKYSITDSGKQNFIKWVSAPMEIQNSKILNWLNYTLWAFQQKKNVSQDYKSIFKVKKTL